jgi:tripartite-type tricarboxylate transporter receptor subunit TctC
MLALAQSAADYPTKPVKVILGQSPGGGTDIQARLFSAKLTETLGQPFIVDNKPGAANTIAFTFVIKSPPDGYTLLATTPSLTFGPAIQPVDYDPLRDFTPISAVTRAPYLLVVNAKVPVNNIREYVAYVKANPGKLNAGVGTGTLTNVSMVWLNQGFGLETAYIPYKGTGPVLKDITAGVIQVAFGNPLSTLIHVKSGKLKALATSMNVRSKVLPDLPTIAESGIPDYDINTWHGWLGPAKLSPAIATKLADELRKVVNNPDINEKLKDDGGEPMGSTPEEYRKLLVTEVERWKKVLAMTKSKNK